MGCSPRDISRSAKLEPAAKIAGEPTVKLNALNLLLLSVLGSFLGRRREPLPDNAVADALAHVRTAQEEYAELKAREEQARLAAEQGFESSPDGESPVGVKAGGELTTTSPDPAPAVVKGRDAPVHGTSQQPLSAQLDEPTPTT